MMKNAIEAWLNSPEKNYKEGLGLLRPLCRNRYLLRSLSLKENRYNRAKLENELHKAVETYHRQPHVVKQVAPAPAPPPEDKIEQDESDPEIDLNNMTRAQTAAAVEKLEVALGKMHNKKGILSNSLRNFDIKDKENRKAVLSRIDGLTADMNEIRGKLAYHQKHGKLPPVVQVKTKKEKPIPDDPVKMKEMLLNLRTSRTKINKQLKTFQNLKSGCRKK